MKSFLLKAHNIAGAFAIVAFVAGPAAAYFRLLPPVLGFLVMALGCLVGLVVALIGVIVVLRSGPASALASTLAGAIPAVFLIYSLISSFGFPILNDVTTDLAFPPTFEHAATLPENQGRDMAYPERFKSLVKESYPDLTSLGMTLSVDDAFGRGMDYARQRPNWEVTWTEITENESVFEGYAETKVFRFVDDFVVRVTKVDGGGCVVDMRSKSRDGEGDFGSNAKRIRMFFDVMQGS